MPTATTPRSTLMQHFGIKLGLVGLVVLLALASSIGWSGSAASRISNFDAHAFLFVLILGLVVYSLYFSLVFFSKWIGRYPLVAIQVALQLLLVYRVLGADFGIPELLRPTARFALPYVKSVPMPGTTVPDVVPAWQPADPFQLFLIHTLSAFMLVILFGVTCYTVFVRDWTRVLDRTGDKQDRQIARVKSHYQRLKRYINHSTLGLTWLLNLVWKRIFGRFHRPRADQAHPGVEIVENAVRFPLLYLCAHALVAGWLDVDTQFLGGMQLTANPWAWLSSHYVELFWSIPWGWFFGLAIGFEVVEILMSALVRLSSIFVMFGRTQGNPSETSQPPPTPGSETQGFQESFTLEMEIGESSISFGDELEAQAISERPGPQSPAQAETINKMRWVRIWSMVVICLLVIYILPMAFHYFWGIAFPIPIAVALCALLGAVGVLTTLVFAHEEAQTRILLAFGLLALLILLNGLDLLSGSGNAYKLRLEGMGYNVASSGDEQPSTRPKQLAFDYYEPRNNLVPIDAGEYLEQGYLKPVAISSVSTNTDGRKNLVLRTIVAHGLRDGDWVRIRGTNQRRNPDSVQTAAASFYSIDGNYRIANVKPTSFELLNTSKQLWPDGLLGRGNVALDLESGRIQAIHRDVQEGKTRVVSYKHGLVYGDLIQLIDPRGVLAPGIAKETARVRPLDGLRGRDEFFLELADDKIFRREDDQTIPYSWGVRWALVLDDLTTQANHRQKAVIGTLQFPGGKHGSESTAIVSPGHGLKTGEFVLIEGVKLAGGADGIHQVTALDGAPETSEPDRFWLVETEAQARSLTNRLGEAIVEPGSGFWRKISTAEGGKLTDPGIRLISRPSPAHDLRVRCVQPHGLSTGMIIQIVGVEEFPFINDLFTINTISNTEFDLVDTRGLRFGVPAGSFGTDGTPPRIRLESAVFDTDSEKLGEAVMEKELILAAEQSTGALTTNRRNRFRDAHWIVARGQGRIVSARLVGERPTRLVLRSPSHGLALGAHLKVRSLPALDRSTGWNSDRVAAVTKVLDENQIEVTLPLEDLKNGAESIGKKTSPTPGARWEQVWERGGLRSITWDKSNGLVIESPQHGLRTGDHIEFEGAGAWLDLLRGQSFAAIRIDSNRFRLDGTDLADFDLKVSRPFAEAANAASKWLVNWSSVARVGWKRPAIATAATFLNETRLRLDILAPADQLEVGTTAKVNLLDSLKPSRRVELTGVIQAIETQPATDSSPAVLKALELEVGKLEADTARDFLGLAIRKSTPTVRASWVLRFDEGRWTSAELIAPGQADRPTNQWYARSNTDALSPGAYLLTRGARWGESGEGFVQVLKHVAADKTERPGDTQGMHRIQDATTFRDNKHSSEVLKDDTWISARLLNNEQVLGNWKRGRRELYDKTATKKAKAVSSDDFKPKLVLVTTSGGGIRAATWTLVVLRELERRIAHFPYHIRLITGASGGMMGAACYGAALQSPTRSVYARIDNPSVSTRADNPSAGRPRYIYHHPPVNQLLENMKGDFLSPVFAHAVFHDIPLMILPTTMPRDRGKVLEDAWRNDRLPMLARTVRELAGGEWDGWRPSLIFSPMLVEDGRRLLISNLDLDFIPRNVGHVLIPSGNEKISANAKLVSTYAFREGFDIYSLSGVEFFRMFPAAWEFKLSTAVRLSASFPIISPAVSLPTIPPRRAVDAGYYDNYGVNLACLWIDANKTWLQANTSGVVLVQIRDHQGENQRRELTSLEERIPPTIPIPGWFSRSPRIIAIARSLAQVSEGFRLGRQWLTSTFEGVEAARRALAVYRNDEQVEALSNLINFSPEFANKPPGFYSTVVFENPVEAAINWKLSPRDYEQILRGFEPKLIDEERGQKAAAERNLERLNMLESWWLRD